jgi:hypothetical protein
MGYILLTFLLKTQVRCRSCRKHFVNNMKRTAISWLTNNLIFLQTMNQID